MNEQIGIEQTGLMQLPDSNAVAMLGFAEINLSSDDDYAVPHRPDVSDEQLDDMIREVLHEMYPLKEIDPAEKQRFLEALRNRNKSD